MSADRLAQAAASLVGTRFRLHGRDPATGLDCAGLLAAAMARAGKPVAVPTGYRLRNRRFDGLDEIARKAGFIPASGEVRRGDVLLLRPSPVQMHLCIVTDPETCVHAHAGRGCVVVEAFDPAQRIAHHWRLSAPTPD